jgi:hypothetical protein
VTRRAPAALGALLALLLPACGARAPALPPDVAARFETGADAMEQGDFGGTAAELAELARCTGTDAGREALLLLAVSALDPRNPDRSPTAAIRHSGLYLRLPTSTAPGRAMATAVFLLGLELGGDTAMAFAPPARPDTAGIGMPRGTLRQAADAAAAAARADTTAAPAGGPEPATPAQRNGAAAVTSAPDTPVDLTPLPVQNPFRRGGWGCVEVAAAELRPVPRLALSGPTLPQRLAELEAQLAAQRGAQLETQRQDLGRRLRASEETRQELERRLAEVTAELERVRQILRQ